MGRRRNRLDLDVCRVSCCLSPRDPLGNRGYGVVVDASAPGVFIPVIPDQRGGTLLRSILTVAKSQGFEALSSSFRCNRPVAVRFCEGDGLVKPLNLDSGYPSQAMKVDFSAHCKDEGARRTEAPVSSKP